MDELDVVRLMVESYLGYGVLKVGKAPIDATYELVKERSKKRLEWVINNARRKKRGADFHVSDRVAFKAMTEAAFTDDTITADYLGGVLAAGSAGSDAGAPVVAVIGRLSANQLRLHYLIYREVARLWPRTAPINLYQEREANLAAVRVPAEGLVAALGASGMQELGGSVKVLVREGLFGGDHQWGVETIGGESVWTLRVRPSALGAELYLWGRGADNVNANAIFGKAAGMAEELGIPETNTATLVSPPNLPGRH